MHPIHHTEGFIIGSIDVKEADKFFTIFTRDFGLIRATAGGIRKISSKLRFILHDFSHARIDLVEGRDVWRITSASKTGLLDTVKDNKLLIPFSGNIFSFIKRLCHGEEKNYPLYETLVDAYSFLQKEEKNEKLLSRQYVSALETVVLFRILNHLGYNGNDKFNDLISTTLSFDLLDSVIDKQSIIISSITSALADSHL